MAASPGTLDAGRRLPASGRSGTWCCCATRSPRVFRTTDRAGQMLQPLPTATIRTQLQVPLRSADGFGASARVFSFDGLIAGQEHIAFGLGDRAAAVTSA